MAPDANTQRVAICNIGKCMGSLVEPSPHTASCKMSGNKPGGLWTANRSHDRLKKLQPLAFLKTRRGGGGGTLQAGHSSSTAALYLDMSS